MGASKTFQYTNEQNKLARTAKALGHSARITIVEHLVNHGFITNAEVMMITKLSDGTIAQHLKELVVAGIITEVWIDRHYYILTQDAKERIDQLSGMMGGDLITG